MSKHTLQKPPDSLREIRTSDEPAGGCWCGRGSAQMTGAALMQGNSPLTRRGRVEGLATPNSPPKWSRRCRLYVCCFPSWLPRSFVYMCNHKCHLVPVTNRFMDLDISSSSWKAPSYFAFSLHLRARWGALLWKRDPGWRILSSWKSCLGVKLLDFPCQTSERAHQRGSFITNHRHHLCSMCLLYAQPQYVSARVHSVL